jgi:hypothetical protein
MPEGRGATQCRNDEKATLKRWPALAVLEEDRLPSTGVPYSAPPGYRPGVASHGFVVRQPSYGRPSGGGA